MVFCKAHLTYGTCIKFHKVGYKFYANSSTCFVDIA